METERICRQHPRRASWSQGSTGFIGSHVVDAYLKGPTGFDVAVVDNLATGSRANLNPAARFYEADVGTLPTWSACSPPRAPGDGRHHAAQAISRLSMEDPPRDAMINVIGSLRTCSKPRVSVSTACAKVIYAATGGAAVGEPQSLQFNEVAQVRAAQPVRCGQARRRALLHAVPPQLRASIRRSCATPTSTGRARTRAARPA